MGITLKLIVGFVFVLSMGANVYAQENISWADLSLEERQTLEQLESQWDSLPARRQAALRRGVSRWQKMQP
ncbi:MAG: hypothetical protein ACI95C_001691 [Pseudohongiellaceae bacterium]|jgi:hypothetical protein